MERHNHAECVEKLIASRLHLANIENFMIGSSVIREGQDRPIDVLDLVNATKNNDPYSYSLLFTPLALLERLSTQEEVLKAREKDKSTSGLLPIFEFSKQFTISRAGYKLLIELGDIERQSGFVWPTWGVSVIDSRGERVSDKGVREFLEIDKAYSNVFELQKTSEDEKMRLVFNL